MKYRYLCFLSARLLLVVRAKADTFNVKTISE
jgi:hypothetical protein